MKRNKSRVSFRSLRNLVLTGLLGIVVLVFAVLSGVSPFADGGRSNAQTVIDVQKPADDQDDKPIHPDVLVQIAALLEEKETRTSAQAKIDSNLLYKIKIEKGEPVARGVEKIETGVTVDQNGNVPVDITAHINERLLKRLRDLGATIIASVPRYRSMAAWLPIDAIEPLAEMDEIIFIQPKQNANFWQLRQDEAIDLPSIYTRSDLSTRIFTPAKPANDFESRAGRVKNFLQAYLTDSPELVGSQNSQGDTTHKANTMRSTYGGNGAGLRIGVLSNGVVSLAASQALGDLGPVTVLPGQRGTGDEGTAMLEIVHDLAPGAELYFATANPIIGAFAQNIKDLRSAGCDIIIDDVFYFVETPFQDGQAPSVISTSNGGLVTQAVNDVIADGALFFSSAGNQGNLTDVTSSCYQGDFVSAGSSAAPLPLTGTIHDFDPGAGVAAFDLIQTASGNPINLYWADPLGGSANDYDLFILNSTGTTLVASSTNVQSGTQDPFEQTNAGNATNNRVVVLKKTGAGDRFFHLTINANGAGRLGTATDGTTKGHSTAALAYGVAATPAAAPGPFPAAHSGTNVSETFSSDGPRRLFFQANGTAFTPGDFSSTGGTLRQKPDVTAADRVSVTGVGGFPTTFSGTSAAAPHAGAIAALLLSQFPSLTPAQVRTILTSTAIDIETAGVDRTTGVGIIMPFEAAQSNGAVASANFERNSVTATEVGGNANTFIEPGETGSLNVNIINTGVANATAVSAVLTTTTAGVIITNGSSAYPNIAAPAGTGANITPFTFQLSPGIACDLKVNFTLSVTYSAGNSPKEMSFTVQTGRPPANVVTTIDASVPPASVDYTAVTGTQTNRVTRDGRAKTCNLPGVTCPGITAATNPRYDAYTFATCPLGGAKCVTATLTTPCPSVAGGTQLFITTYLSTFVPANVCTNYLGDSGSSPAANGSVDYTFRVPAGSNFVLVVSEVPGVATNCNYTLNVSGLCNTCPSAAPVMVGGRVADARGRGIIGARVSFEGGDLSTPRTALTNSFGYFMFNDVSAGQTYVIGVSHKRYSFAQSSQAVSVSDNITDLVFQAN